MTPHEELEFAMFTMTKIVAWSWIAAGIGVALILVIMRQMTKSRQREAMIDMALLVIMGRQRTGWRPPLTKKKN